jgi:hypothetical protein
MVCARQRGGFHFAKTSENLGRRWTVKPIDDRMGAVVGNNASYAPDVQARDYQKPWHKQHGWLTAETVVEEEGPEVLKTVQLFISEALKRRT